LACQWQVETFPLTYVRGYIVGRRIRSPGHRIRNPRGTEYATRGAETLGIEIRNREHRIRNPQAWNAQCTEASRVSKGTVIRYRASATAKSSARPVPCHESVVSKVSFMV
jgi:hypothetical protein